MKMTALDYEILDYMKKLRSPVAPEKIAEVVDRSPITIRRRMSFLYRMEKLKRWPGKGHSYLYGHPEAKIKNPYTTRKGKAVKELQPTEARRPIDNRTLYSLLSKWAQESWTPKVTEDTPLLPQSLARVYELAAEQSYGSVVPQSELDHVRKQVELLKISALALYTTVASIHEKNEMWDAKQFASFLLAEHPDVEGIKDLAASMKELNR